MEMSIPKAARLASPDASCAAFITDRTHDFDVIRVYGEIDRSNYGELRAAISRPHGVGHRIVVDLSDCNYIDLAGLRELVRVKRESRRYLQIVAPLGSAAGRAIELSGLHNLLAAD